MKIDLTGHHVEVTQPLRDHVHTKFSKLERHFDHVVDVHVILTVEKTSHQAEATLRVSGARLFATATHADMYAAVDALSDKLDRQVVKHKEKRGNHHRPEGSVAQVLGNAE